MKKNCFALAVLFASLALTGCQKKIKVYEEDENHMVFKNYQNEIIDHKKWDTVQRCQYDKSLFKINKRTKRASYDGDANYTYRLGLDISRHDGTPIDWNKVKADGWEFIIFRIGWRGYQSGVLHVDENFHENIKGAIDAGFDIGVYVFSQAINEEEAVEEAELCINELKDYKINLPVVFDPETITWEEARTDDITMEQFTKNTIAFCNRIKEAGYEPMIYSNITWEAKFFDLSQLAEYKLWFADYQVPPTTPYHFEFWQYGGEWAKIPGIPKGRKVDVDMQLIPVK